MRTLDLDQFWPTPSTPPEREGERAGVRDVAQPASHCRAHTTPEPVDIGPQAKARLWRRWLASRIVDQAVRGRRLANGFDAKAAAWASLGFVAGMVAWHAVGFWGFVHTAVLSGGMRSTEIAGPPVNGSGQQPRVAFKDIITTGSLPTFSPKLAACVSLVVDPTSRATIAEPCNADTAPMRDAGKRRRAARLEGVEARLRKPEAWSIDTQSAETQAAAHVPIDRPAPVAAQQTIVDTEFDLTIKAEQSALTR